MSGVIIHAELISNDLSDAFQSPQSVRKSRMLRTGAQDRFQLLQLLRLHSRAASSPTSFPQRLCPTVDGHLIPPAANAFATDLDTPGHLGLTQPPFQQSSGLHAASL